MRPDILTHCRARQLEHALAWSEAEEASLRAAYASLEYAKTKPFDEAMRVPAIAIAVRNVAHAMRHTAGELFNPEEPRQ